MPRSLRRPLTPKGATPPPKDSTAKSRDAVRKAQQAVAETIAEDPKAAAAVERLLPRGFTPALNPETLPPAIRAKVERTQQEVLASIDPHDGFIPTPAQCEAVYDMAKWGVPMSAIRLKIINPLTGKPIGTDTLKKYFHEEMSLGDADAKLVLAKTGFNMATETPDEYDEAGKLVRAGRQANPSVLIALSKHRLGWFENKNIVVTHNHGVDPELAEALEQLSEDELRTIRQIADRRADQKAEGGP